MTLGNGGNTHGFQEFQFHDFSPSNNFNSYLTVVGSFTLHSPTLVNMNTTMKSGTLLSEVASRMK